MDDFAAFMTARYDEAERTARAASMAKQDGEEWHADPDPEVWGPGAGTAVLRDDGGPLAMAIGSYAADHIVANDPKHRLADIALKRAILAEHASDCCVKEMVCGEVESWYSASRDDPCATARQLGTEFAEHAAYRPEWAPEGEQ